MYRSRECGHTHLQSFANAKWGKPLSPCLPYGNKLVTSSTKALICIDRLLPHLRRDRRQLLVKSLKGEKRPTKRRGTLVDAIKMDRLLQQLRTNAFVGTIDPKYHSHYLSEALLQEYGTVSEMKTRRSFASVSKTRKSSPCKTRKCDPLPTPWSPL
jgi:hypothetical protein